MTTGTILMSYVDLAKLARSTAQADIHGETDPAAINAILHAASPRVDATCRSVLWLKTDHRGRRLFLLAYYEMVAKAAEVLEAKMAALGHTDA